MLIALPTSTSHAATTPRLFISLSSTQGEMPISVCISTQHRSANASRPCSLTMPSSTTPSLTSFSKASFGTSFHEL